MPLFITLLTILFGILGALFGNYITSVVYRMPRRISLQGFSIGFDYKCTPPMCSSCFHKLKFWEFLPILSWFSCRGRCNYCDEGIPKIYFVIELFWTALLPYIIYIFHESERYELAIVVLAICSVLTVFFSIIYSNDIVFYELIIYVMLLSAIYRLLECGCIVENWDLFRMIINIGLISIMTVICGQFSPIASCIGRLAIIYYNLLSIKLLLIYLVIATFLLCLSRYISYSELNDELGDRGYMIDQSRRRTFGICGAIGMIFFCWRLL